MMGLLEQGLHSPNGFVRKGCAMVLRGPKQLARLRSLPEHYRQRPPVLANSFPKSGTHLLDQIVEALPARRNFGAFLGSHISSFQYRLRSERNTINYISGIVPGEIVRAHLFHSPPVAEALRARNIVHYFIIRDPRDVVLSESHYLRNINRWHRLHRYFRDAPSIEEAISLAIRGLPELAPDIDYPDIAQRFQRYAGWLNENDVLTVRFDELVSDRRDEILCGMAQFYAAHASVAVDVDAVVRAMQNNIDPHRSHTFRKGKSGGWREQFSGEHRRLFDDVAGHVLQKYGFAADGDM